MTENEEQLAFEIIVQFTADWHIGTGTGRAKEVDAAIARDPFGLPFIPAKTMLGVLRDSAEIAAAALDADTPSNSAAAGATFPATRNMSTTMPGIWQQWVDYIFGSQPARERDATSRMRRAPIPAALIASPLTFPYEIAKTILAGTPGTPAAPSRRDRINACTVIRPGASIDEVSGTVREDFLRFEERARAGLTLGAAWTLRTGGAAGQLWPARLLLMSAARLTDAIGGKRRRGAGQASVSVDIADDASLTGWFDQLDRAPDSVPDPPKPKNPRSARTPKNFAGAAGELTHRYDLDIETVTPLLVDTQLRGNVVTSASSVPGSNLLPIVGRLVNSDLGGLIRAGRIVVTSANVVVGDERGLPWPQGLAVSEDDTSTEAKAVNLLVPHEFNSRLKPKPGAFVRLGTDPAKYSSGELSESIHAIIDDERQRPTSETGGLFVYCGIAPGTRLRAEVWLPDEITLQTVAAEPERIGRSAKDDYGNVRITVREVTKRPSRSASPLAPIKAGTPFTVWLTSDAILRNDRGAFDPRPENLMAQLATRLGCDAVYLALPTQPENGAATLLVGDAARMSVVRRDSWQATWGLPRPSLAGIAAGSVFRLVASTNVAGETVKALERDGVGERRAEGYGRLLVNHPALAQPDVTVTRESGSAASADQYYWQPKQPTSLDAKPIITAAWQRRIDEVTLTRAPDVAQRYLPASASASQFGTLRQLVMQLSDKASFDRFDAWHARCSKLAEDGRPTPWNAATLNRIGALVHAARDNQPAVIWAALFGEDIAEAAAASIPNGLGMYAVKLMLVHAIKIRITRSRAASHAGATAS